MQSFQEHYFTEKLSSEILRAFTSNIFKKRKVGVDLGKGKYKIVVPAETKTFKNLKDEIKREVVKFFKSKRRATKSKNYKVDKSFVKNVYEGDIDSGENKLEGSPIATIVYQLNNGANIAFITTEDIDGQIRRYISTNSKGNDFFRTVFGTTLQQINADAKRSSTIISKEKPMEPDLELLNFAKSLEKEIQYNEPSEPTPLKSPEEDDNEIGIMDISVDEFESLKEIWGTGRKGGIVKGMTYPFRNKFLRKRHSTKEGYTGYKYYDNEGHTVYLLDTGDGENALIGFKDRESYDWAHNLEMLNYWRGRPSKTKIRWQLGTIDTL